MAASTVLSLVSNLATTEDKLSTLEDLKVVLVSIAPQDLTFALQNLSILPVFECLNSDDKVQQEVCCSVLDKLLSALNAQLILENLSAEFIRWLHHGTAPVQTLCLSQLLRVSRDNPELVGESRELLEGVAAQLANSSQHLASMATSILVSLAGTAGGLDAVYSEAVLTTLQTVMDSDDSIRFRVYQLVVEVSCLSPQALEASLQSGLLTKLCNEMQRDDILLQLNCLELLSDLAQSSHGLAFLDTQGVITRLEQMMVTSGDSSFAAYLLPGLMKFFGGIARFHPKEVLSHFQGFVGLVFSAVAHHADPSIKGLAVDTLGFVAATPEGKRALDKQGNAMTECLGNLGSMMKNSPSNMRVRVLEAVASLMGVEVADQTDELLSITETWFTRLCPNPFDAIWTIAKQPFNDLRLPALKVMSSLALTPWGQQLMNNAAGFKEYLLDRGIETTAESKQAKFEIISVLAQSPTVTEVFGRPYYVHLMEFYRQGPFFVQTQSEVAFEET